jgi:carboxymethylenebutenolidase
MCHAPDAAPPAVPALPGPVFAVAAAEETLVSGDGTVFAVHRAALAPDPAAGLAGDVASAGSAGSAGSPGAAVLILPDNRGLTNFYRTLASRLAARGHHALVIDYYARTAGTDLSARAGGFNPMRHLASSQRETLFADIEAALADLRGRAGAVFSLGFCFGGRLAFLTSEARFGLAGVAGFYGFPGELFGVPGPTRLAAGFAAPVLGVFGADDAGIDAACRDAFAGALSAAGVRHDLRTYEGVGHSFFEAAADPEFAPFDPTQEGHKSPSKARLRDRACADAWTRVVAFIEHAGEQVV